MASSLTTQCLSQTTTLHLNLLHPNQPFITSPNPPPPFLTHHKHHPISLNCTTNSTSSTSSPEPPPGYFPTLGPESETTVPPEKFPVDKQRRSEIVRGQKSGAGLVKPEPPNFEIGWKRTKSIQVEKPTGYVIMDFLEKLEGLMGREFGSTKLLAKAGEIVAERAREQAEVLRDEGKVEERMVTELFRVKAAVKEKTSNERLEQARARCRQAILVANSF